MLVPPYKNTLRIPFAGIRERIERREWLGLCMFTRSGFVFSLFVELGGFSNAVYKVVRLKAKSEVRDIVVGVNCLSCNNGADDGNRISISISGKIFFSINDERR